MNRRAAVCLCAVLWLGGCMVGPEYHRPEAVLSIRYKELAGWTPARPADATSRGAWWSIYDDPLLDSLERRIAVSNQNVKSYQADYAQAQAIVQEARAQLFPTLSATAGVTRSSRGGANAGFAGAGGNTTTTQYTLTGSASWDLDLWGRIRRQVQSDVAAAQVSAADLQNATLSAQATLASDYVELRYQDSLGQLLAATVRAYEDALRITRNQVDAGITSPADAAAAETQLESTRASLVNVGVSRGQYEHAIAVLTGVPPAALSIPVAPLATPVPVMPPGLPSTLLQRRPDVAAAARWAGGGGGAAPPIGMLISAANRVWSLGASATETIFEGGARSAAVAAARAAYDASVASYRQTVLTAIQQVEDELVALRILERQAQAEDVAVRAAQRSVDIALNEYRAGTEAYTTVVTEQELLLTDQEAALQVQEQRLLASVALVQALGGGWSASDLPGREALQTRLPFM
jgi:outer membrane protein TolC